MSARLMNTLALVFALAATAIALGGALRWLAARPHFDLRAINVRGDLRHVTAASLRAATAGRLKGNYFTLRLDDTRRLLESVPWVSRASVRRVWPDRLQVTLIEHRALGIWSDGRLLADDGELFVANPAEAEIDGPLPVFEGPAAASRDAAQRYYEFAAQLAPLDMTIVALDVSERRSWTVRAVGAQATTTFELGRDGGDITPGERLARVVAAFPMVATRVGGVPQSIDARYASGLTASPARNPVTTR
jgi:cell division protein FtsQ